MILLQTTVVAQSTLDFIDGAFQEFRSQSALLINAARVLGGIGAMVYLVRTYAQKLLGDGSPMHLLDFAPPVMIALLLSVYPLVGTGLEQLFNGLSQTITQGLTTGSAGTGNSLFSVLNKSQNELAQKEAQRTRISPNAKDDQTWYTQNSPSDTKSFETYTAMTNAAASAADPTGIGSFAANTLLTWIMTIIGEIGVVVIYFLSKLYIAIYYVFGPLSIAFSLLPGFENSLANWFQKYISYCLWPVLANTLEVIVLRMVQNQNLIDASIKYPLEIGILVIGLFSIPKLSASILSLALPRDSGGKMLFHVVRNTLLKP